MRFYINDGVLFCPLNALRRELIISESSKQLREDDIWVLRHHVVLDIGLNNLNNFAPLASLDPALESLQWIRVLFNAVNLDLLPSALAGAHQFGEDQAFARADIVADNDSIFLEGV